MESKKENLKQNNLHNRKKKKNCLKLKKLELQIKIIKQTKKLQTGTDKNNA